MDQHEHEKVIEANGAASPGGEPDIELSPVDDEFADPATARIDEPVSALTSRPTPGTLPAAATVEPTGEAVSAERSADREEEPTKPVHAKSVLREYFES